MVLTILVIAVALGTEPEFKLRIGNTGASAHGAAMSGDGGIRLVHGLPVSSLPAVSDGMRPTHKTEEENDKIQQRHDDGDLGSDIAHDKLIGKKRHVQISQPLDLHRDQEHEQKLHVGIDEGKGQEQGHVDVVGIQQINVAGHKISDKSADDGKDHAGEIIDIKPEGTPGVFQILPQHIIQIKGKNEKDEACIGRLDQKGEKTPHLPAQDHRRIQAEIVHIERWICQLDKESDNIKQADIAHQTMDGIAAQLSFQTVKKIIQVDHSCS